MARDTSRSERQQYANTLPGVLNQVSGETRRLREIFRLIKSGSKFALWASGECSPSLIVDPFIFYLPPCVSSKMVSTLGSSALSQSAGNARKVCHSITRTFFCSLVLTGLHGRVVFLYCESLYCLYFGGILLSLDEDAPRTLPFFPSSHRRHSTCSLKALSALSTFILLQRTQ